MMIIKHIYLLGVVGLASIANQASAQYENNHQQVFFVETRMFSDTKALTPVKEKISISEPNTDINSGWKWAYASTVAEGLNAPKMNAMLVKLKANLPLSNPFALEWAREYSFSDKNKSIDVEDVFYYTKGKKSGYILCGSVQQGKKSEGFLMMVRADGSFQKAKTYPEVSVFKSVVPWQNNKGFIAVGKSQSLEQLPNNQREAVYVSVKSNLNPVCNRKVAYKNIVESGFNKVIQYKVKSKVGAGMYAVVGETTSLIDDTYGANSDVLVGLVDALCGFQWLQQFGSRKGTFKSKEISERGLSIAQLDKKKGGVVVTGNTKDIFFTGETQFDDVLVFTLDNFGTLNWMGHYSIQVSDISVLRDIGTAVQMSTAKGKKSILVAGETETSLFVDELEYSQDAFLMDINMKNGNVALVDVFGVYDDRNQGALSPGNVDLHLSQDHHAVIMGNTKSPGQVIAGGSNPSNPYLIERYKTINQECRDERFKIKKREYEFPGSEVTVQEFKLSQKKTKLQEKSPNIKQKTECEKFDAD